jgi:hypothetical protein
MCDTHGRHLTTVNGVVRCVLCGHILASKVNIRFRDWPGELLDRHRARQALWRQPHRVAGGLFYPEGNYGRRASHRVDA